MAAWPRGRMAKINFGRNVYHCLRRWPQLQGQKMDLSKKETCLRGRAAKINFGHAATQLRGHVDMSPF